jgi:GNAT superfamily N-acetyltransferase
VELREARRDDLTEILRLLVDGQVGSRREHVGAAPTAAQLAAFDALSDDPNQLLVCGVEGGHVVATAQLSFIPGLARDGAWRMQIEAMRVRAARRGQGLGDELLRWALERARERGCALVQLTSDAVRSDAHRFYRRFGFEPSHVGFRLPLELPPEPGGGRSGTVPESASSH